MHEHIKVTHEKDSFNKHLRNYRFNSSEVDHVLKESSATIALKTEKKPLNSTSLKILMCTYMAQIFNASQHVL